MNHPPVPPHRSRLPVKCSARDTSARFAAGHLAPGYEQQLVVASLANNQMVSQSTPDTNTGRCLLCGTSPCSQAHILCDCPCLAYHRDAIGSTFTTRFPSCRQTLSSAWNACILTCAPHYPLGNGPYSSWAAWPPRLQETYKHYGKGSTKFFSQRKLLVVSKNSADETQRLVSTCFQMRDDRKRISALIDE